MGVTPIKEDQNMPEDAPESSLEKSNVSSARAKSIQPSVSKSPPPSNFKACSQCLGAFFLFFNSWGLVNAFGSYQAFYEHGLLRQRTLSQISWIGSVQAFLFLFGGVIAGPLYDRGYLRVLVSLGSFLVVFGMMMTSLCSEYWQIILAQGLVVGLGNGCLFVPSTAVIPPYFSKRRALAMGIAICGGNLGGLLYSIIFERLQPSIGFPWATRTIAFIQLATLTIPILVLQTRFQPVKSRRLFDIAAWKDPRFSIFACVSFMGYIGLYIPWFYANSFANSNRIVNAKLAVYQVTFLNTGSFVGRIILTFVADKIGPVNMLLICFTGSAILAFCWISVTSTAGAVVFNLLYGCFSGALISLVPTVIATILCPDMSALGVRLGILCISFSIGFLVGSPLGGLVLHHGWTSLQVFAGAMLIVGLLGVLVVRFLSTGASLKQKC